jgi:type I restriction enzyme M protein
MMLDTQTKSKIDSARDILVGKVPDPKSQVEQITIALIYKFMDDMDRQSEELGGKVTFFTGEFKKYRWANLLDKRLGGHERLGLYSEGLDKMNTNKNIPQLFRDIFKGVFLPYRDPETLNLFLKEIGSFNYDHSERLGDAYEYLLNILGTQGDAGQFRTPRHIIDFIVAVVDPQKNETVLDPACGTAGFLISAFKHILRNNENLTPDERARLMTNFRGYDIAPDMVRLSRVNMYLHSFPNPVIHEYDALTSEERWDERCDVILANPPFMSPKGGIRPHNRFSIKAKRSEVLFVDYMAEHLNSGGRAGIIVPEGIIFQSQNAYKALRKMLVENYLWAVVSLPAGVFNPYSGVKTSILLLDRNLARRTDELLFVKVESDGFDLGAQRRPIEKNDLPEVLRILDSHKKAPTFAKASAGRQEAQESKMALTVSRKRLLESGDISLSGDRYRVAAAVQSKWPLVTLGEVALEIKSGFACGTSDDNSAGVPHLRPMNISTDGLLVWVGTKYISEDFFADKSDYLLHTGDVLFNNTNSKELVGKTCLVDREIRAGYSNHLTRIRLDLSRMMPQLLALLLHEKWRKGEFLNLCNKWVGQAGVNNTLLTVIEIPLPTMAEQERIVAELDGYRKVIEGARQVLANYKPIIKIDPTWPIKPLGEVITLQRGYDLPKAQFIEGPVPVVGSNGIIGYHNVAKEKGPGVVTGRSGTIGKVHFIDHDYFWPHNTALFVKEFNENDRNFIKYLLESIDLKSLGDNVAAVPSLDRKNAHRIPVPLPPLSIQREIVAEIEAERALVEANRKLIEIFEKKIQVKLAEIWSKE